MVTISFPGLGISSFTINKVAFTIPIFGGISVRWYGILITVGIVLAFFYAYRRSKQEGIILDDLLDIAIYTVISAVIGARAYYVLTSGDSYNSFYDIIAIWNGGIAIYGAVIAGSIALFAVCKVKKINWKKCFDMVGPAVMIGQILGRWGNFCNGEAFGSTPEAGSILYPLRMEVQQDNWFSPVVAHPTFLYESVWNLIGFLIINALYRKKRFDGEVFLSYLTWYGFGRFFIEGLRTDSLYIGKIRISQLVGAICFVAGLSLIVYFRLRAKKNGTFVVFADGEGKPVAQSAVSEGESSYSRILSEIEDDNSSTAVGADLNNENSENSENKDNIQ